MRKPLSGSEWIKFLRGERKPEIYLVQVLADFEFRDAQAQLREHNLRKQIEEQQA